VSFNPGVELVLEAFDQYWRKPPQVKRVVFKVIPDESTRLAALKRGEIDIVYSIRGELAEELRRTPGLTLKPAVVQGVFCLYFPDQWDPKSPWHDERVRRAASLAIDREGTNEALTLGYSLITGNPIVADHYEFFWQPPFPVYDPDKAKQLLAEAGFPRGFDAEDYYCDSSYANIGEAVLDNLRAVGIRPKLRPIERPHSSRVSPKKPSRTSFRPDPGRLATPRPASKRMLSRAGFSPTGVIPTSTSSISSKRSSSITRSARRFCTRCSRSFTSARSTRQYGSLPSSTASAHVSASRASA
jgi:peptide/nickel transport system substrate-binding protein